MKQRLFLIILSSLLILILIIGSLAVLVKQLGKSQFIAPRAAVGEAPKDIRLTNLTENSVAVSWITDEKVTGVIKYGADAGQLDKTGSEINGLVASTVHHITLKPLKPETTYYFRIQSGTSVFDDSGQPFAITTPKVISTPPPPQTIYGSILSASSGALTDKVIVYIDIPNSSTPLSTLADPDSGNWSLSISTVRAAGGNNYLAVAESTIMKLFVQGGSQGTSTATVKISNAAPIPPISLNQTYAFDQTIDNSSSTFTVKPNLTPTEVNLAVTNITEGQTLTDPSPTFTGTAPPAVKITVTVKSPATYTADVTVKPDGSWSWTPPADLAPGSHTITITYTDETGQAHTESKTFLVQSASVSVTPTPLISSISQISPIPTVGEQQLPAAGSAFPTTVIFSLGLVSTFLGIKYSLKKS